jgi:large conductance mechanosensitive channel
VFKEFREFLSRGNVADLAVAVVVGAAFTNVVNALVEGLITPLIAMFGDRDYTELDFTVSGSIFRYGLVITAAISFAMVAGAVFLFVVKPLNALEARRRRGEVVAEERSEEAALLAEIRDLLRERREVG